MGTEEHEYPPGENAADVCEDTETWNRDQRREILGRNHEFNGIERHHPERIDLLRHHHGADLSGKCRSRTPAHRNCSNQRAQFTGKANGEMLPTALEMLSPSGEPAHPHNRID